MRKLRMFITAVCVLFLIKLQCPKNKSLHDTVLEKKKSSGQGKGRRLVKTPNNFQVWKHERMNTVPLVTSYHPITLNNVVKI